MFIAVTYYINIYLNPPARNETTVLIFIQYQIQWHITEQQLPHQAIPDTYYTDSFNAT